MYNTNIPSDRELPSTAKLVKSTLLAAVTACILLVAVVMPAEYGIDLTGFGKITGLQKMGEIKMSLAQEAKAEPQPQPSSQATLQPPLTPASAPTVSSAASSKENTALRTDETKFNLAPNQSTEIKVDLKKDEIVKFVWSSNAGKANFDTHADSKDLKIDYHGYGKGSSTREEGTIKAAFDGSHGWFWRNRSGKPLTITLVTEGPYTNVKR